MRQDGTANITHNTTRVNGVRLHYVTAGEGAPLVLLHGYPQTCHMWRKVIPTLAEHFTIIAPDLRGYGDSDKPVEGFDKRTMAQDIRDLARSLGHEQFYLTGHDRGARVAYRCALDHPEAVTRLVLMDIIPTGVVFRDADAQVARRNWHWFFFQIPDLPELLLNAAAPEYLAWTFRNGAYNSGAIEPEAVAEYTRAFTIPGTIRCVLEDYRAGATTDTSLDLEDLGNKVIEAPTLVLWGSEGSLARRWSVMDTWRQWARDVQGEAIEECGHYLPEERPELIAQKMLAFLK